MKNVESFLKELKGHKIDISLSKGDLKVTFKENTLTDAMVNELKSRKKEIIDYLTKKAVSNSDRIPKAEESPNGYPLTPTQRRAWILNQLEGYNFAYNMHETLVIEGDFDFALFEEALHDLIEKYEILRTVFSGDDEGVPRQFVKPAGDIGFKMEFKDISHHENAFENLKTIILEEIKVVFDLEKGPLVKCIVYKTEPKKWVILFVLHHIVGDSKSVGIMKREVLVLYTARKHGRNWKEISEPLRIQYKDFAVWKENLINSDAVRKQREYWLSQFADKVPVLELPLDHPRPVQRMVKAGLSRLTIESDLLKDFKTFCASQHATLFTGIMSLINLLFYKYTGQRDIVLGFPVYGREFKELEDQIGFFADTLALRTQFEEEFSFRKLLSGVSEKAFQAYENRDYPFEQLVNELNPTRDSSRTIFFDVFVVLQNFHTQIADKNTMEGFTAYGFEGQEERYAAFDIVFNITESPDGLHCTTEFNQSIFNRDTIERMLRHLRELMQSVVKDPDAKLKDVNVLPETEKTQLLTFGNAKSGNTWGSFLFPEKGTAFIEKSIYPQNKWSLETLHELSNRFANYLVQEHKIRPNTIVTLSAEQTDLMLLAMMGILKTGAVCYPNPDSDRTYSDIRVNDELVSAFITAKENYSNTFSQLPEGYRHVLLLENTGAEEAKTPFLLTVKACSELFEELEKTYQNTPLIVENLKKYGYSQMALELLFALYKGKEIYLENTESATYSAKNKLDFSLYYFGNEGEEKAQYKLLIEGAKYADKHGYNAIWTPERHFNEFGGPYPNPSVLGAAIASVTRNVSIRAGSVVAPLHHPIRVAEEWSVVDNLSGGRVMVCFASGWNANDFVIKPENYKNRREILFKNIEVIRELWTGEKFVMEDGEGGTKSVSVLPKPVQKELPFLIASSGNIETFKKAGEMGGGVLTGLVNSTLSDLKEKVDAYRKAYRENGHPEGEDKIVLMLHTYIDATSELAAERTEKPLSDYLMQSLKMTERHFSAQEPGHVGKEVTQKEVDELIKYSVKKYREHSGLIGSQEEGMKMLEKVSNAGVDEIACLIDFGVDYDHTIKGLDHLTQLKDTFNQMHRLGDSPNEETHVDGTFEKITEFLSEQAFLQDSNLDELLKKQHLFLTTEDENLPELFTRQALAHPEAIALISNDTSFTYRQIHEQSNKLANYLLSNGIRHQDIVSVCLSRSPQMIIALLGVMKSGAVYMPVDPDNPKERIHFMIQDAKASLVLTETAYQEFFDEELRLVLTGGGSEIYDTYPKEAPKANLKPDDLAYIIYTSGSTGNPKGVKVKHRSIHFFMRNCAYHFNAVEETVFPLISAYTFDIFLFELFYPWLSGGTSVLMTGDEVRDISNLTESLKKVNAFHAVPALMEQIIENVKQNNTKDEYLQLREVYTGGDRVPTKVLHDLRKLFPHVRIHVLYGPTEATVFASHKSYEPQTAISEMKGSILGAPNFGVEIYIMKEGRILCPTGVAGEICIAGPGVADGYINREELTASHFIPHPEKSGKHLYRTGDLGRWLSNGSIEFVGRMDDQVKIRGYRVELGEIEKALTDLDTIASAVVITRGEDEGSKELIAYVKSDDQLQVKDLRYALTKKLPGYMIPEKFIKLDTFPLTATGKVDRKALPEVKGADIKTGTEYLAPRNEMEEQLVHLWQEILNVEKVGVRDNFFDLGGHSVKAIKLRNHLYAKYNVEINLPVLFNNPTVENLANELEKALWVNQSEEENEDVDKYSI
ncbi:MupA/Atu3671 family FMN-dependent luciferase-like monooxygenase [Ascidiimonas aurantiaca]|uniref:MupA/Atu3671 family FMN-dependent luciferase-like monooxygenase n=1 Tax=Ascidiimonas aurantiaca TaxID=1685432 RepID=UPI0030EC0489